MIIGRKGRESGGKGEKEITEAGSLNAGWSRYWWRYAEGGVVKGQVVE